MSERIERAVKAVLLNAARYLDKTYDAGSYLEREGTVGQSSLKDQWDALQLLAEARERVGEPCQQPLSHSMASGW